MENVSKINSIIPSIFTNIRPNFRTLNNRIILTNFKTLSIFSIYVDDPESAPTMKSYGSTASKSIQNQNLT